LQLPGPELNELGRAVWAISSSELNKAYRKLSLLVHPDKAPGPESRQAFEQLKQAYHELKNADKMVSNSAEASRA
jgi:DnaJ family protein C protein 8